MLLADQQTGRDFIIFFDQAKAFFAGFSFLVYDAVRGLTMIQDGLTINEAMLTSDVTIVGIAVDTLQGVPLGGMDRNRRMTLLLSPLIAPRPATGVAEGCSFPLAEM